MFSDYSDPEDKGVRDAQEPNNPETEKQKEVSSEQTTQAGSNSKNDEKNKKGTGSSFKPPPIPDKNKIPTIGYILLGALGFYILTSGNDFLTIDLDYVVESRLTRRLMSLLKLIRSNQSRYMLMLRRE